MKPVFDNDGLAIQAGDICCFYYDELTGEYTGWSDEFINIGVSMPRGATDIDPGEYVEGNAALFNNGGWKWQADHRGETVYSTADGRRTTVDYIGEIRDGFTIVNPDTPYDVWDGNKWVTDSEAQHAADVAEAEQQKEALLSESQKTISFWQTELQLGIISDEDKASLIEWLAYIKAVKAVTISTAPEINWPFPPKE